MNRSYPDFKKKKRWQITEKRGKVKEMGLLLEHSKKRDQQVQNPNVEKSIITMVTMTSPNVSFSWAHYLGVVSATRLVTLTTNQESSWSSLSIVLLPTQMVIQFCQVFLLDTFKYVFSSAFMGPRTAQLSLAQITTGASKLTFLICFKPFQVENLF